MKTKKQQIDELQYLLQQTLKLKSKIHAQLDRITDKQLRLQKKISKLSSEVIFPEDSDITLEKIMELSWSVVKDSFHTRIIDWIYNNVKYLSHQGYVAETDQIHFSTKFYKDVDVEPQIAEVENVIKYIKPISLDKKQKVLFPDKTTLKILSVMDEDCSVSGVINAVFFEDGTAAVTKMTYSRLKIVQQFDSVRECLIYIHKMHWYE